ncbi:hypothetical protein Glove_680g59 [Diversispora epigaea]|uniref:Uncharacterized protein n=1 Tax=Diversispora epigaea TaxID=1348612 RepID=A0A397G341_9GLOM|nr:hypothetical protein Glove_680g59 [Diversispora epigaea]
MSAKKTPEDDQLELPITGSNTVDKLLLNLIMNFSTTDEQVNSLRKLYHFIIKNINNNSEPTEIWFQELLNLLEDTRDSSKSIIENRETINSEIWLKIDKFVEKYDKKELNLNTLLSDPSKTPPFKKGIDNESKTKAFSSSPPLILENSVKNLQSSSKRKLSDKDRETSTNETKRKSEKPPNKNNKRTKKYTKQSEIVGTSIMNYPVKDPYTTLIWKCQNTDNNSQIQEQQHTQTNNIQDFDALQHNFNHHQDDDDDDDDNDFNNGYPFYYPYSTIFYK